MNDRFNKKTVKLYSEMSELKVENKALKQDIQQLSLKITRLNGLLDDKDAVLEDSENKRAGVTAELAEIRRANKELELKNIEAKQEQLR